MSPLLTLLRTATTVQHETLHVHPLLAPLQQESISMDDYRWCIKAFYQAYLTLEQAMHYQSALADVPALKWLEKDMQSHGIKAPPAASYPYPPIDTMAKYMGYLYVKQGSTLGGRVISRQLHKNLGLVEHHTNHFFAGFGEETGTRWKQFVDTLENENIAPEDAVQQAVETFKLIEHCCDNMLALKQSQPR